MLVHVFFLVWHSSFLQRMSSRLCVRCYWQDLWKASGGPWALVGEGNRVWAGFAITAQYATSIWLALKALLQVIQNWKGDWSIENVHVCKTHHFLDLIILWISYPNSVVLVYSTTRRVLTYDFFHTQGWDLPLCRYQSHTYATSLYDRSHKIHMIYVLHWQIYWHSHK